MHTLRWIGNEADRLNTTLPLATAANSTYQAAKTNEKDKLDMTAVYLELKANIIGNL